LEWRPFRAGCRFRKHARTPAPLGRLRLFPAVRRKIHAEPPIPMTPSSALPSSSNALFHFIRHGSLVTQILIGLAAGVVLASVSSDAALAVGLFGNLFVTALKSIAPILVFVLVAASIASHQQGAQAKLGPILALYLFGTFAAALVAVVA